MRRSVLVCCLVVGVSVNGATQLPKRRPPSSGQAVESKPTAGDTAGDLFAVLDLQAQKLRLTSSEKLLDELALYGFKRTGDFGSVGTWQKSDSTGVLRVGAFFLDNESSIWLFFFPTVRVPMPDPASVDTQNRPLVDTAKPAIN